MSSPNPRRTKLFISYSQESTAHRDRVFELKRRLMRDGIACVSDHSFAHKAPPQGWLAWMEDAISDADYVLVVCTETYRRRAERKEAPGKGLGVIRETAIINKEIYNQAGRNDRFIPVILDDEAKAHIPEWLSEWTHYHVETDEGYELLLRHLLDMPLYEEPELGEPPVLLPRVRVSESLPRKPEAAPPLIVTPVPEIVHRTIIRPWGLIEYLNNNVQLELRRIEAGTFMMGTEDRLIRLEENDNEKPQHLVTIAEPFYMGKYPVTQAQWQAVMHNNPSHFKGEPTLPVERVSWEDAAMFCEELSKHSSYDYRLPTEAEWEYACRACTTTRFCFGDNDEELAAFAWYIVNAPTETHPVGQKRANAWGLYDMHGNLWEWCQDVWHDNYKGAPPDGSAWLSGGESSSRVLRGGSWGDYPINCRSTNRNSNWPGARSYYFGLRVVARARTS